MTSTAGTDAPWADAARPAEERVDALIGAMTLREKVAQLYGVWVGADRRRRRGRPAPARAGRRSSTWTRLLPQRPRPADPAVRHRAGRPGGRRAVAGPHPAARSSRRAGSASRRSRTRSASPASRPGGRPSTPSPLCLGRDLRPRRWSSGWRRAIGADDALASACTRASRRCSTSCATRAGAGSRRPSARTRTWSARSAPRTCAGLESAGIVATLKHFVGYSASRAGPQPRARLDRARASSPTCCCRRSRWRCATAAPGR